MYACMECGKKFKTTKAAERASNNGCPGCNCVDIDLEIPEKGFQQDPQPKYDVSGRPIDDNGEIIDR